ncbi:MAG: helix-turn-helix domain-containing protein [Brevirhabdus sp.]
MTRVFQPPLAGVRFSSLQAIAKRGRWRTEAMRSYDTPTLIWFTRGQGRFTANGQTRGYGPHTLVLLPAGTMHGFEAGPSALGAIVHLTRADGDVFAHTTTFLKVLDHTHQGELTSLLERLARETTNPAPGQSRAVRALADLVLVWVGRRLDAQAAAEQPKTGAQRLAAAFTHLLEEKFSTGTNVADYARVLGVTPTHLSRACREASGKPASALLQDRVFFEARQLLLETDLAVNQIARRLGFTSAAYFSRAFLKHVGRTPSAFRRNES